MSFLNQIGQVSKKLIDYSVYNSPTQIAMQYMGKYANQGPMSSPGPQVQTPMANGGYSHGAGGPNSLNQGLSQQGNVQRDPVQQQTNGLLASLIQRRGIR